MMLRFILPLLVFVTLSSCSGQREVIVEKFEKGIIQNKETGIYGNKILGTGKHTIKVTEEIVIYNVGDTKNNIIITMLTKDSLSQEIDVKFEYKIQEENLLRLNYEIGKRFEKHVITPQIMAWTKGFIGQLDKVEIESAEINIKSLKEILSEKYYIDLLNLKIEIK